MTIEQWLDDAKADAHRRQLPELAGLLEGLAKSTAVLRSASWNDDAAGRENTEPANPAAPAASHAPAAVASRVPSAGGATITALAPRLARGEVRATQLTETALAAIAARDPELNAFITVLADRALRDAVAADKEIAAGRSRGPLHGIPFSLKDLIDVAGVPTTAASRLREHHVAAADAPIVTRLRAAGAIIVGKTNLHEFAFGTTNEDSGWGPARNPFDTTRSPGGSSGGSAASVQAGMAVATIGTDTGGSIRIPAAACGIVGLKPAWGEVDATGVVPLSRQLDHVGPLARSVDDAALVYRVLTGTPPEPVALTAVRGLRLAVLQRDFVEPVSDGVAGCLAHTFETLERAGAVLTTAAIPHAADIAPIYLHLVLADAAAYHTRALERQPEAYTPNVRIRLEMGRYVVAEDYARALQARTVLRADVERALAAADALILPALAVEAPPIGAVTVAVRGGSQPVRNIMLRCTQLFNLTGHPAASLPCGTTANGLPVGMQIVARNTADVLRIARAVEAALADA